MRFFSSDDIIDYRDGTNKSGSDSVMDLCKIYGNELTEHMEMKKTLVDNYHKFISENKEQIDFGMSGSGNSVELIKGNNFPIDVILRDGQRLELIPWAGPHKNEFHGGYQSTSDTILYATIWEVDGNNVTSHSWDIMKIEEVKNED